MRVPFFLGHPVHTNKYSLLTIFLCHIRDRSLNTERGRMEEKVGGGGSWNLYSAKRGSPVFHQQKGDAHKLHQSS